MTIFIDNWNERHFFRKISRLFNFKLRCSYLLALFSIFLRVFPFFRIFQFHFKLCADSFRIFFHCIFDIRLERRRSQWKFSPKHAIIFVIIQNVSNAYWFLIKIILFRSFFSCFCEVVPGPNCDNADISAFVVLMNFPCNASLYNLIGSILRPTFFACSSLFFNTEAIYRNSCHFCSASRMQARRKFQTLNG